MNFLYEKFMTDEFYAWKLTEYEVTSRSIMLTEKVITIYYLIFYVVSSFLSHFC